MRKRNQGETVAPGCLGPAVRPRRQGSPSEKIRRTTQSEVAADKTQAGKTQDGASPKGFLGRIVGFARGLKKSPEAYSAASWSSAPASSGNPGRGRAMPRAMKLWRMG